MSYNFDPDKWYDNELAALKSEYESGQLTSAEYEDALTDLGNRLAEMWDRLDGSYIINS